MVFKQINVSHKFTVCFWKCVFHSRDVRRGSDSSNNIFTLCVDEVLTIQHIFTCARVPSKTDACARRISHVSEHHCLYIHSGTFQANNLIDRHVFLGTVTVPAVKHSMSCLAYLFFRFLREHHSSSLIHRLIPLNERSEMLSTKLVVVSRTHLSFKVIHLYFKEMVFDAHDNVTIHVKEASI